MIWTGSLAAAAQLRRRRRPRCADVHETVGVIDVSTLGKLLVAGPDAAAFLERLYPNRFGDLKSGRDPLRRALHRRGPDHGRRHDRAGSARSTFYVTTTSTGADGVLELVRVVERRLAATTSRS